MKDGLERPYTAAYTKRMTNRQRRKGGGAVGSRGGEGSGGGHGRRGDREQGAGLEGDEVRLECGGKDYGWSNQSLSCEWSLGGEAMSNRKGRRQKGTEGGLEGGMNSRRRCM